MSTVNLAIIAVMAPLVAAALLILIPQLRRTGLGAALLSVVAAAISFITSAVLLGRWATHPDAAEFGTWRWLPENNTTLATIGIQVDGISVSMLVVVSLVALCVQVFSLEYMSHEDKADFGRYFTWQSLFLFSMQGLVIAPNMLQLFACWELVGLCSYLLIGFYWKRPAAARAALKAFWITKLADMGLLIGLIVHWTSAGSFGWEATAVSVLVGKGVAVWVAALYFIAVMGKSAQFPFHVWLPNAMEGPTPVSALLHAATMVAAGVYLMVRAWPIFAAAEALLPVISVIGGGTAIFAACVAIVQTDIKKVLAYSTCSQLGYMVAALGAGSLMGGYFHLTTHAAFKALLFLAAGSVIHAVNSNEMKDMGGLRRKMPLTTVVFIIGSMALAGLPLMSGFYSKDLILETLYEAAIHDPIYWAPFLACMITAGLTAYYMGRVVFMTFFGTLSENAHKAHEGGPAMLAPLLLLGGLAAGVGWAGGSLAPLYGDHDFHFALFHVTPVGIAATTLAFGGIAVAWALHMKQWGHSITNSLSPVGDFIRYGAVDRAWLFTYRRGMVVLSHGIGWFDRYIIDGLMNVVGGGALVAGQWSRKLQTGRASDYLYAVALGVLVLVAWTSIVTAGGT